MLILISDKKTEIKVTMLFTT